MTSGELQAIFHALGRLEQAAQNDTANSNELWRAIEGLRASIAPLPALIEKVEKIVPKIEEWNRAKTQALAIAAFIAGIAGIAGWFLNSWNSVKSAMPTIH